MSQINLQSVKDNFIKELSDAKAGIKTSLPFIINQVPTHSLVTDGEIFQVLTIGGSVCRKALLKKNGDKFETIEKEEKNQPNFNSVEDFLGFITGELSENIEILAINFAQALKPIWEDSKLDGILLNGSKESKFDGLVGKKVGYEVEQYVQQKTGRKLKVSVANDTLCLLLSGLTISSWDKLVGGILGTGLNFAFFLEQGKAVNLEAAEFNKFPLTSEGRIIDENSSNPSSHLLEKEVAGGYLFQHFNLMIKDRNINYHEINSSKELDEAAKSENAEVAEIAQLVIRRAADLIGSIIAGFLEYKAQDLTFVMEGSVFWKGVGFKERVEEVVKELAPNYNAEFIHIKDSTILGGAKLVA